MSAYTTVPSGLISLTQSTAFICCLGPFGLATLSAEQRFKEIGVRKIMGASVPTNVTLVSSHFLKLVVLGMLLAFPISWYAMDRWLMDFAY